MSFTCSSERWLPIPGYEGRYEVSDHGRVRSLDRIIPWTRHGKQLQSAIAGRVLKPWVTDDGYLTVQLSKNPKRTRLVHTLVLEAFVGPRPDGLISRHYPDRDPTNNLLSNLSYATPSQNNRDKVEHGTDHNVKKTHCKHGHEYTTENTYAIPSGGRACRRCMQDAQRRYHAKKRAARGPRQPNPCCPNGHSYIPENTRTRSDGCRQCIICYEERLRRYGEKVFCG